jgi:hypothetical protein
MADKQEQYKNRIIAELYQSGIMQKKIPGMCSKNYVSYSTRIHEDILQEVFWHMSRLRSRDVIEMYEDKKNGGVTSSSRLVRLATRITSLKGFAKKKDSNYPKQSFMTSVLFASNLSGRAEIGFVVDNENEIEEDEEETKNFNEEVEEQLIDKNEPNLMYDVWELVREKLSKSDLKFLEMLFTTKKGKGKYKQEVTDRLKEIKLKIKEIVKESDIKI